MVSGTGARGHLPTTPRGLLTWSQRAAVWKAGEDTGSAARCTEVVKTHAVSGRAASLRSRAGWGLGQHPTAGQGLESTADSTLSGLHPRTMQGRGQGTAGFTTAPSPATSLPSTPGRPGLWGEERRGLWAQPRQAVLHLRPVSTGTFHHLPFHWGGDGRSEKRLMPQQPLDIRMTRSIVNNQRIPTVSRVTKRWCWALSQA